LFGAGITPPRPGGKPDRGGQSPGGSHSHGAVGHGSTRSQARDAPDPRPPALVRRVAAGHASSGGGSSALVLLAGAIGVLALAAFAGIVLRHSRRPTATS
jgi:hypothetical protein